VTVEESCRGQGKEKGWVPNLVNTADGVKSEILNSETLSRYEKLYEVVRWHAADTG